MSQHTVAKCHYRKWQSDTPSNLWITGLNHYEVWLACARLKIGLEHLLEIIICFAMHLSYCYRAKVCLVNLTFRTNNASANMQT